MKMLRDVDGLEKQFDTGYRNLRVLYEALQPDEQLRDFVRPYAWLTKLYMLYRKKFYPEMAMEAHRRGRRAHSGVNSRAHRRARSSKRTFRPMCWTSIS